MSSTLKIILIFFFISNCSFNSNSKFWTKEKSLKNEALTTNQEALFKKKKNITKRIKSRIKD